VNGAPGDGAELEDSSLMALEGKFKIARFPGLTVEMWVKVHILKSTLGIDRVHTLER
jgi:hypothetical protein